MATGVTEDGCHGPTDARRLGPVRLYLAYERAILGATGILVVLVLWEGVSRGWWAALLQPIVGDTAAALQLRPIFVSAPTRVLAAAYELAFVTGELWRHLLVSGQEFALGYLLAVAIGIPLGLAAGWNRRLCYALNPFLVAMNATPQIALYPLIILWAGIGLWSKVLVIFLLAVLPIALAGIAGAKTIDARFVVLARSFGASERRVFVSLVVPSAVPFLLTGCRIGVGRAMIGVVAAEFFAAHAGIGHLVDRAGTSFQTDTFFVGVIVLALAGLGLTELIGAVERRVEAWRPKVGATA